MNTNSLWPTRLSVSLPFSPPLSLIKLHSLTFYFLNMTNSFQPKGLCTCYLLCLKPWNPDLHMPRSFCHAVLSSDKQLRNKELRLTTEFKVTHAHKHSSITVFNISQFYFPFVLNYDLKVTCSCICLMSLPNQDVPWKEVPFTVLWVVCISST